MYNRKYKQYDPSIILTKHPENPFVHQYVRITIKRVEFYKKHFIIKIK